MPSLGVSSTAPNASNAARCASLMPVAPVMFMPAYGPGGCRICTLLPVTTFHRRNVPSALPLARIGSLATQSSP